MTPSVRATIGMGTISRDPGMRIGLLPEKLKTTMREIVKHLLVSRAEGRIGECR